MASRSTRFLLSPKWLAFHALVIGSVVLMISLGFWQLRRLDERRADNAVLEQRAQIEPVPIAELVDPPTFDPDAVTNRLVVADGTYLPDQIVLFNRSQNGAAVDNVLTPLVLDDGRVVLVNRGAIGVGATPPLPPAVGVEVIGRLRPSEVRQRGGLSDSDTDVIIEVRRVDIERLAPQLGGEYGTDILPMYIELIASSPAVTPNDPNVLGPPEAGEGNHLSYAFQWFIFAICVLIGWVLAIRRSLASRARVSPDAAREQDLPDSPAPVDDASTMAQR